MLRVNLETVDLNAGQTGYLIARSNSRMSIEILCYVQPPRPPQLKGCPTCGEFKIQSGQRFSFSANRTSFERSGGYLQITIRNREGEIWQRKIDIQGNTLTA